MRGFKKSAAVVFVLLCSLLNAQVSVPECAFHDPAAWHPLLDTEQWCRWDHGHGDDPLSPDVLQRFGDLSWLGQEVGASFLPAENHSRYVWLTGWGLFPADTQVVKGPGGSYVESFRIQLHVNTAAPPGGGALFHRYHGATFELRVCRGTDCGVVRLGNMIDFGNVGLLGFGYNPFRVEGLDPPACAITSHRSVSPSGAQPWYGLLAALQGNMTIRSIDALVEPFLVDPSAVDCSRTLPPNIPCCFTDVSNVQFVPFCPALDCSNNQSRIEAFDLVVNLGSYPGARAELPPPVGGFSSGVVYFEPFSGIENGVCFEAGPTCAPLIVEGAPYGDLLKIRLSVSRDWDVSPPGQWWWRPQ